MPVAVRLVRLHEVVQATMGWENAHLHVFSDGQTRYGVSDPELEFHDEHAVRLNELVAAGGHLEYTYDFGDSWDHDILIEEATVAEADRHYPRCVGGGGLCPPEDPGVCGAISGWSRSSPIRGTRSTGSCSTGLGLDSRDQFDPTHFDPDDANGRLTAGLHAGFIASRS